MVSKSEVNLRMSVLTAKIQQKYYHDNFMADSQISQTGPLTPFFRKINVFDAT